MKNEKTMKDDELENVSGGYIFNQSRIPGGGDDIYRLDHAVSATQKKILKAFNISATGIMDKANTIKNRLIKAGNKNNK